MFGLLVLHLQIETIVILPTAHMKKFYEICNIMLMQCRRYFEGSTRKKRFIIEHWIFQCPKTGKEIMTSEKNCNHLLSLWLDMEKCFPLQLKRERLSLLHLGFLFSLRTSTFVGVLPLPFASFFIFILYFFCNLASLWYRKSQTI